jgi:uncharacterized protein YecT (DUF1311 family)
MTITRQQVDAWDAEVNAAYERGRQQGMKQERALWTLTKLGQEIEAQRPWVGLSEVEVDNFHRAAWSIGVKPADFIRAIEAKLKEKNT